MANSTSTYQAGVVAASGSAFSPNRAPLARKSKLASFECDIIGSHQDGDIYTLGSLSLPNCFVKPEGFKLRFGGTGTVAFKATLQKVDVNGLNPVALTAQSANVNALTSVISFTAASSAALAALNYNDQLQLLLNYGVPATLGACATTSGSTSVTVATTTNLVTGMQIAGPGIPIGATVTAISSLTLTISIAATATATGVALTAGTLNLPNTVTVYPEVSYDLQ